MLLNALHCKKGMILFETEAKGMAISIMKPVENDLSILSCHLVYGPLKLFHTLLIANRNYKKASAKWLSLKYSLLSTRYKA